MGIEITITNIESIYIHYWDIEGYFQIQIYEKDVIP